MQHDVPTACCESGSIGDSICFGLASKETILCFKSLVSSEGSVTSAVLHLLKSQQSLTKRHKFDSVDTLVEWTVDIFLIEAGITGALDKLDDFVQSSRLDSRAAALEELMSVSKPQLSGSVSKVVKPTQASAHIMVTHAGPSLVEITDETDAFPHLGELDDDVGSDPGKVNLSVIVEQDHLQFNGSSNYDLNGAPDQEFDEGFMPGNEIREESVESEEISVRYMKRVAHGKNKTPPSERQTKPKRRRGRPRNVDVNGLAKINPICDVCGKAFSTPSSLSQHSLVHTGERPFVCHMCGQSFRQKGALGDHVRTHSTAKEFECEICGQQFRLLKGLREHLRLHTGEKPYKCKVCGAMFARAINFRQHATLHTGEKNFKCSYCDKTFRKWCSRQKHERVHSGVKPYSCPDCGKAFTQKYNMKVHRRKAHPGAGEVEAGVPQKLTIWGRRQPSDD